MQKNWSTRFHEQFQCLLIPDVFSRYDKVLFLNLDILINRDVAELYQTKLTDNEWIGAVIDTYATIRKRLTPDFEEEGAFKWIREPLKYFNSGVILYNLNACRKNKLMDRIVRQHAIMGLTYWKDQDLLNICCQGHVHFLNPKWNVQRPNFDGHFALLAARGVGIPGEKELYNGNREHPYILHFVGAHKPWKCPQEELNPEWWKYARALPNYEEIIYTNICGLVRGEMTKKLEEPGKREHQTVDRLGLLEARQGTADRVMSTRLNAAEQAVRKVRSDAREVALLPFTWLNLQRCRIASHLLFGKTGQHYTRKKRKLRARVRTALDFIRTQPNVSKNSTDTI